MPRTGPLLTLRERQAFAPWLRRHIDESGVSKTRIAAQLGGDSTQRLNRYISETDPQLPTPQVLVRIAHAVNVAWPVAFLYAGYFREVLGAIERLAAIARDVDASWGRRAVIRLALDAFPRRDVRPAGAFTALEIEFDPLLPTLCLPLTFAPPLEQRELASRIKALTRGLSPLLARASAALLDGKILPATARAIAGEYVNAWADQGDCALAEEVRTAQRQSQRLVDVIADSFQKAG